MIMFVSIRFSFVLPDTYRTSTSSKSKSKVREEHTLYQLTLCDICTLVTLRRFLIKRVLLRGRSNAFARYRSFGSYIQVIISQPSEHFDSHSLTS